MVTVLYVVLADSLFSMHHSHWNRITILLAIAGLLMHLIWRHQLRWETSDFSRFALKHVVCAVPNWVCTRVGQGMWGWDFSIGTVVIIVLMTSGLHLCLYSVVPNARSRWVLIIIFCLVA